MLAEDFSREELSKIYSADELDMIYTGAESTPLITCGDYSFEQAGEVTFYVFEKETLKPLMKKIIVSVEE